MLIFLVAAIGILSVPERARAQQPPTTYAITHAKIVSLASSPIEDGTLVIKDGKIAAVGASGAARRRAGHRWQRLAGLSGII
jgi:cytosine/adenosine deaminase-related metal-dependent hydrolase